MPFDPQDYRDRAAENLAIAEKLRTSDDPADRRWSVVILHYSAVHLINAGLLAAQYGDPGPPTRHDHRWHVFEIALEEHLVPDTARTLAALNNLRAASEGARYEARADAWWEQLEATETDAHDSLTQEYQQIIEAIKGLSTKT